MIVTGFIQELLYSISNIANISCNSQNNHTDIFTWENIYQEDWHLQKNLKDYCA